MKINLHSDFRLAVNSLDHIDPLGSVSDNHTSIDLINEIGEYYKGKVINFLDVGCAGGQFVIDMLSREFTDVCIGIEGSSTALDGAGRENYNKFLNKNLFLCDASEPYYFTYSNKKKVKFDLIFSSDVIEHISNDKIDQYLDNMFNSLNPYGMVVLSIGLCDQDPRHVTIFSKEGWEKRLSKYNVNEYPFENTFRPRNDNTHFLCLKKLK